MSTHSKTTSRVSGRTASTSKSAMKAKLADKLLEMTNAANAQIGQNLKNASEVLKSMAEDNISDTRSQSSKLPSERDSIADKMSRMSSGPTESFKSVSQGYSGPSDLDPNDEFNLSHLRATPPGKTKKDKVQEKKEWENLVGKDEEKAFQKRVKIPPEPNPTQAESKHGHPLIDGLFDNIQKSLIEDEVHGAGGTSTPKPKPQDTLGLEPPLEPQTDKKT